MRWLRARDPLQAAKSLLQLTLWMYVNVTILLGGWVLLGAVSSGWSPIVITSGSMEPTVGVGDVLLVDSNADRQVGQRSIVVFERDGETIAHRVFAVEGNQLVTKGDANPTPDLTPIALGDVDAVGRLVVPFLGLPLVWFNNGMWLQFGAWVVLAGAAAVQMAIAAERSVTQLRVRRRDRSDDDEDDGAAVQIGVQRVRVVMAILVAAEYMIGADRLAGVENVGLVAAGVIATLFATNLLSAAGLRRGRSPRQLAAAELGIDTLLAIVLVMATGSSGGLSWVLFALPIVEAAARFRLSGAVLHWISLTFLAIVVNVWATGAAATGEVLSELKTLLDQLTVLFLMVVPAGYLAEQLTGQVTSWRHASGQAEQRSRLLVRVANVGRDVARLEAGSDPVASLLDGVRSLGFTRADLVVGTPATTEGDDSESTGSSTLTWRVVAGDPLTPPGGIASGLEVADLEQFATFVDCHDEEVQDGEAEALSANGLSALLAHQVTTDPARTVVVRAGVDAEQRLTGELVEAFRLLVAQAVVALRNGQLLDEVTTMHDELEYRASHDALTGLPNRVLMLSRLRDALPHDPVVFFLDLNGFKPVNDRLGHDIGDVLLQLVSERIPTVVPEDATVARLGGDEFTILIPRALTQTEALDIAHAVFEAVKLPFDVGREEVIIGTSIGIAFTTEGCDEAELIRRSDVAMYRAKHQKDTGVPIELYRPDFDNESALEAAKAASFAEALNDGSVYVVFQPVFEVDRPTSTRRIAGAEALIRWEHPEFGFVPPPEIIEIARKAGLDEALLQIIFERSCAAAERWRLLDPDKPTFISINASPDDLAAPGLADRLARSIAEAGIPIGLVHVELNEHVISPPSPAVAANIAALDEMGIGLLLDDFGQGNVSLSYLHQLPLSGLKLDRSLVVNAARSDHDRVVLRSVTDLADRLGLLVIAEGVEDEPQLDAVTSTGCSLIQGFLFARPGPASVIDDLVRERRARIGSPGLLNGFPTPSLDALPVLEGTGSRRAPTGAADRAAPAALPLPPPAQLCGASWPAPGTASADELSPQLHAPAPPSPASDALAPSGEEVG